MVDYSFLGDSFIRNSMSVYPDAICPFRFTVELKRRYVPSETIRSIRRYSETENGAESIHDLALVPENSSLRKTH
jgi:hypothetical protein